MLVFQLTQLHKERKSTEALQNLESIGKTREKELLTFPLNSTFILINWGLTILILLTEF